MWRSSNATVRNGLLAGNNANTGTGTMFEQSTILDNSWGLAKNLQAYHIGGCCFSTYGGTNITWDNVQCKDNHCEGVGGRPSSLGSLMFFAGYENPGDFENCCPSSDISITGEWYNSCNLGKDYKPHSDTWIPGKVLGVSKMNPDAWVKKDLTMKDFQIKAPIELELCFMIGGEKYVASTVTQENVGLYGDGSITYKPTSAASAVLNAVELPKHKKSEKVLESAEEQTHWWNLMFVVLGVVGLIGLVVGKLIRHTTPNAHAGVAYEGVAVETGPL